MTALTDEKRRMARFQVAQNDQIKGILSSAQTINHSRKNTHTKKENLCSIGISMVPNLKSQEHTCNFLKGSSTHFSLQITYQGESRTASKQFVLSKTRI